MKTDLCYINLKVNYSPSICWKITATKDNVPQPGILQGKEFVIKYRWSKFNSISLTGTEQSDKMTGELEKELKMFKIY